MQRSGHQLWMGWVFIIMFTTLSPTFSTAQTDRFIPAEGMILAGPAAPTTALSLAGRHFCEQFERFTGQPLPIVWGYEPSGAPLIKIGNQTDLAERFNAPDWTKHLDGLSDDVRNQSYIIDVAATEAHGGRRGRRALAQQPADQYVCLLCRGEALARLQRAKISQVA